jgi:L,D-transpeptidase ErfK/SrfK
MYPDDVASLFPLVPVGTPVRLINEPVKVAWIDGELLLEAHPPVDAQGQSFEPELEQFSQLLQAAVGDTTVAIHWDYAREVLQKADGVIATVGLEADNPDAPATPAVAAAGDAAPAAPVAPAAVAPAMAAQATIGTPPPDAAEGTPPAPSPPAVLELPTRVIPTPSAPPETAAPAAANSPAPPRVSP